jgi:hypothetical protein
LRIFKEQDKAFRGVKSIKKRGIYFRICQILVGHREAPAAFSVCIFSFVQQDFMDCKGKYANTNFWPIYRMQSSLFGLTNGLNKRLF